MGAIRLSYSTFGLTNLDFLDALEAVGYAGVEIAFHRDQFNPFDIDDDYLAQVRRRLDELQVQATCVATASHFFDPQRPHEPSLMAVERAARKRPASTPAIPWKLPPCAIRSPRASLDSAAASPGSRAGIWWRCSAPGG